MTGTRSARRRASRSHRCCPRPRAEPSTPPAYQLGGDGPNRKALCEPRSLRVPAAPERRQAGRHFASRGRTPPVCVSQCVVRDTPTSRRQPATRRPPGSGQCVRRTASPGGLLLFHPARRAGHQPPWSGHLAPHWATAHGGCRLAVTTHNPAGRWANPLLGEHRRSGSARFRGADRTLHGLLPQETLTR